MDIPIYIDGERVGILTAELSGGGAELTARMRDVGSVVRLTVFGERTFYLGVPEPEGGEMILTRRLNRGQARAFPAKPRGCARTEEELPGPESPAHRLWLGGRPYFF